MLMAISLDNVLPGSLIKQFGKTSDDGEPRIAVVFSYLVSQCIIFVGGVNAISPIVTNFMLVTFLVLNSACAFMEFSGSPNFRPSFKVLYIRIPAAVDPVSKIASC